MDTLRYPENLEPGTVRRWLVEAGGRAESGQTLVEIELKDSLVHLAAPAACTLGRVIAPAAATVAPGAALAEVGDGTAAGGAAATAPAAAMANPAPASPNPSSGPPEGFAPILMPQAGNTMEEGTILSWKVSEGDRIEAGQTICEIETDKATMEFEAPEAGRLAKIVAPEGSTIPVKQPIAYLGEGEMPEGTTASAAETGQSAPAPGPVPSAAAEPAGTEGASVEGVSPILMPQAGNTMEEGTILSWKVSEGDRIEAGQIICEIETDKATMEFEAPEGGRLAKVVAPEGSTIPVKQPIALLAEDDAAADAWLRHAESSQAPSGQRGDSGATAATAASASAPATTVPSAAPTAPATTTATGRVKASPAARRLAKQRGVALERLGAGSGPGGRILSSDLEHAPAATAAPSPAAPAGPGEVVRRRMTKMRRAIAHNLTVSKQTVPHFYVRQSIDAEPLLGYYRQMKQQAGCTINDILIMAISRVMQQFPAFRSRLEGEEILEYSQANIGIAVGVEDGLVVPVLPGVDRMDLPTLAAAARSLVDNARKGRVDNMGTGTFTISNMGMFGIEDFSAIINPPEAGILAVSAAREQVIVRDGAMRPGRVMNLTLSADHRIVDGMLAAQFMGELKTLLEAPQQIA